MKLPTWGELIGEQLKVMEHPLNQPLFVAGPPGSGKTVLAVRRAILAEGMDASVVLVTYNRMLRRLASLLSEGSARSSTMHSFAFSDYWERTGNPPAYAGLSSYDYDWENMLCTLAGGLECKPRWNHAIVDEGQDLPQNFFRYLHEHAATVLTVFADEDQALGDRRTTLTEIAVGGNLPNPILLRANHRNRPEIAALAEHFHSGILPAATRRRPPIGQRPRLIKKDSIGDAAEFIATWFQNRGGTVGVVVNANDTGRKLCNDLRGRLPTGRVDFYDSQERNENSISLLDDGITIVNKESAKGQEFDTVFILELEEFIPCRNDAMKRAMYMMCARARDYLFLVPGRIGLSVEAEEALPGPNILERG